MVKLRNDKVDQARTTPEPNSEGKVSVKRKWKYLLEICIVLMMCGLLFYGASNQVINPKSDAGRYQCYALVFWKGVHAIDVLPPEQCTFLKNFSPPTIIENMKSYGVPSIIINLAQSQSTSEPFHMLPYEYPLLAIVPFSLGLIAPTAWYQVAFAIWMLLLAATIFFVLSKTWSTSAAIVFAVYLVLLNWGTAAARFDLVPAGLILGAVILAGRTKWKWAYALLALATMFKFFPVVLVVPFLIAQQKQYSDKWYSWHRWSALGVYVGICAVVTFLSFALNIVGSILPLGYFLSRPVQVESAPATLLWLGSFLGYPIQIVHTYGSVNITSELSGVVSLLSLLCLGIGLLFTFWLQWRGKLDIYTTSLLTVLIILITGKIFSPQYLIWIAPLLALVGKANWKWLITWGVVGLLTIWVYPFMYNSVPLEYVPLLPPFYPVVLMRNLIMLGFIIVLIFQATRKSFVVAT